LRAIVTTPNSKTSITQEAFRIKKLGDYLRAGFTIGLDDLDAITTYYVNYYVQLMETQAKQDNFKILGEMLSKVFGGK